MTASAGHGKYIRATITPTLVVLESYVLSALYLSMRVVGNTPSYKPLINPFSPFAPQTRFALEKITYYPWTDMAENVLHAFYVAHGLKFGRDAVVNHLPGVYVYLAAFMAALGQFRAIPSPQTALASISLSAFAVVLFQVTCVVAAFGLFSRTRLGLIAAPLLVFYTSRLYDMASPMSENFIAYLLIPMTALLCRLMVLERPEQRFSDAMYLGGPLNIGCVILGATIFPSNVLIGAVCLCYAGVAIMRSDATRRRSLARAAIAPLALVLLMAAIILATTDIRGMLFWNIDSMAGYTFYVKETLLSVPSAHLKSFATGFDPIGSNVFHVAIASIAFGGAALLARRNEQRLTAIPLLVLVLLLAAWLAEWRINFSPKSAMPFGLFWGLVVTTICILAESLRWEIEPALRTTFATTMFFLVLGAATIAGLGAVRLPFRYSVQHVARIEAFEKAQLCRFGSREHCRCLQTTIFGPQGFLDTDVMPCRDRYASWAPHLGVYSVTRQWIIDDTQRSDVAFLLFADDWMRRANIPDEAISYWNSEAQCVEVQPGLNRLCYAK